MATHHLGSEDNVTDWAAWHQAYDDPSSLLSTRLRSVQAHLSDAIGGAPAGRISLVSLCAGQGRDVIGVLPSHPRREDVRAVLVEADSRNAAVARRSAVARELLHVEVREADASLVAGFADALPADVLLLCGIFGNVSDSDIRRTVEAAPALCSLGASVIWTRHRRPPDLTPQIREWFTAAGFAEIAFDAPGTGTMVGVGAARLGRAPGGSFQGGSLPDGPLFTFGSARPPGGR
ncbi:MAG: SAM-dependent methyltransferase [Streptosporangiaceae bacterium]